MPTDSKKPSRLLTLSWILYDFANTAYSMNVVTFYFPVWIVIELQQSDVIVSAANSLSMILVALTLPVFGDWADRKGRRIRSLLFFTTICIAGTALLGLFGGGSRSLSVLIPTVILIYVLTNYCYQGGLVFYNALMPAVSTDRTLGRVSGYGVALGYLGTIVGLMVAGFFVEGHFYGMTVPGIKGGGTTAAFLPTAAIFFIFAVPIFIFVKEPPPSQPGAPWSVGRSYRKIWRTLRDTGKYPGLVRFLVAKLLYEDSIQTIIIYMVVYTQAVMGFSRSQSTQFLILITPSAILGSALCGILVDHYGAKKTLSTVILSWVMVLALIVATHHQLLFWILGALVGALLGATWTSARPLLISLVPREMLGEFFGLYALSGKVAAITGPLIWSTVTYILSPHGDVVKYKSAIAVLAVIMLLGYLILLKVPDKHRAMKQMQSR